MALGRDVLAIMLCQVTIQQHAGVCGRGHWGRSDIRLRLPAWEIPDDTLAEMETEDCLKG